MEIEIFNCRESHINQMVGSKNINKENLISITRIGEVKDDLFTVIKWKNNQ